jgi:predicted helicase
MVTEARALKSELLLRRRLLSAVRASLTAELGCGIELEEAADTLAQAVVCATEILRDGDDAEARAVDWLMPGLSEWEQWAIGRAHCGATPTAHSALSTEYSVPSTHHISRTTPAQFPDVTAFGPSRFDRSHLYDQFLQRYAPPARKQHGVYFTPRPIADFLVRQVDTAIARDWGLTGGLASQCTIRIPHSAIEILDPACGTGVFLLAVIDYLHARLGPQWNDFVPALLARLVGIELLPVPALLARLNIALKLADTGYDFRDPCPIRIQLGDALAPASQTAIRNPQSAIPIIIGNPPFGSLSTNTNPWIANLVRGNGAVRGYMQAGELRLGERKTWLHDDYVKFIRLAQWHVEQAGQGVVAFVTNHGYLDNATFRLMRQELLRTFSRIDIVDLHGNRKKGETSPADCNDALDENAFGLDQGVAIGVFSRPPGAAGVGAAAAARVDHAELWGSRESKLARLAGKRTLNFQRFAPQPPHFRFVPSPARMHPEYVAGWPIHEAMPANTSAPVTARDHFVVAFTREELIERITEFRDLSISDEAIRAKYFHRTRSRRYPPGDTRGWKLADARRIVAADDAWQSHIIRCLYRPFDWRFVYWHPAMIDWPRSEVTRHLIAQSPEEETRRSDGVTERQRDRQREHSTLCPSVPPSLRLVLITRRQQLPTQPCTFFWISDGLALDGVIRSDNRGSESLFPLWLFAGANANQSAGSPVANLAQAFVEQLGDRVGRQPKPQAILGYIYALFHSPTYRERYALELRSDFPRVLLPAAAALFEGLADIGQRLIELHLRRGQETVGELTSSQPVEVFRVGGYTVLKKWLQPRHRSRQGPEYAQIAAAIGRTSVLMAAIDRVIEDHGGFPTAFMPVPRPVVGAMQRATSSAGSP